ncbi:MAG: chloride channel protein [Methylocapsa sp.]|nr:chloride channel protein [Methylocapsa sp.]
MGGLVRRNEVWFIALAASVGAIAGLCVAALLHITNLLHLLFFGRAKLSALAALSSPFLALIPLAGGLVLGISGIFVRRWFPKRPVDPIEANALHGGRMSVRESMLIAVQTVISSGFGASVGLEAAYTQMGSGLASWLGILLHLRRSDMRMLVACGSAGAISGAFGAPMTGAFYAFELILGTYTPFGLAPVGAAAVSGYFVAKALGAGGGFMNQIPISAALLPADFALLLLLGIICALFGVLMMSAVTSLEQLCARIPLPRAMIPATGGLVTGLLALITPQVLSSGHGALFELFSRAPGPSDVVLITLILKAFASVVSLGTGFRGGLFFASLFLGGMTGEVFFFAVDYVDARLAPDLYVCALTGMAALAVAIIGAPLAMSFLALETTGNFPLALVMLAVASIVSVIVRRIFGYSFATWRLHVRGESIRSAQDVGWMRELTVGRLMRTDMPKAWQGMSLSEFVEAFPAQSSNQWVAVTGKEDHYAGIVFVPDAHLAAVENGAETALLGQLAKFPDQFLLPSMDIEAAVQTFEQTEAEALAAVDNEKDRRVIGLLTEAHVLRRYTDELAKAHSDLLGENWFDRRR